MSKRISEERLNTLALKASGEARHHSNLCSQAKRRGKPAPAPIFVMVDAHELAHICDELKQRRRRSGSAGRFALHSVTKQLIAMAVGDEIEIDAVTNKALTVYRRTARNHLNAPEARWHAEKQPGNKMKITRMPDGSKHIFGRRPSPIIDKLVEMNIGGRLTLDRRINFDWKTAARHRLNKPLADWRTETLGNGKIRVVRVS